MEKNVLQTDIQFLPGVGPKRASLLRSELNAGTIGDFIRIYPFRYIDRSSIVPISAATPDMAYVQIRARVEEIGLFGANGSIAAEDAKFNTVRRMSVKVSDGTGYMELVFFKGIKWMYSKLKDGGEFVFFGKPSIFKGRLNMVHPEVDAAAPSGQDGKAAGFMNASMTGVYPSTEKLKNGGITGKVMNRLMETALKMALPDMEESMPQYLLVEKGLVPIQFAVRNIHFPKDMAALEKAKYRLKFEELFYLQLSLLKQKYVRSRNENGIRMLKVGDAFNICYGSLPFDLTGAQKRVITEIRDDMKSGHQMNRLLQGDVGSGKTMVAVLTALIAVGNGYQACIMAPTEVLAQQHFKNISKYLKNTGVRTALLTGSSKAAERREVHAGLEDGSTGIIVGTHALLEDNVVFRNLGLAVIDEQHRFGVEQRAKLWRKTSCGLAPHVLVMTATPIPRTLAMTLYGDLDVSVIDELPPGRKPIQTLSASEGRRPALFKFMKDQIALGRQIFIVYPLIFESEKMDYKNLETGYEQIVNAFPFPPYRTALVHGKQSNDENNSEEDPHSCPLSGRKLLAEESHGIAVNIALGFRISDQSLELRVFVEVFAAEVGVCSHDEQTDQTGRDGQTAEFNQADFSTVCHRMAGDQSDHRDAGDGHRRADHTHLSSDRGSCHRTFRTDTGLDCDVINNRKECVNRMACTAEDRQCEGAKRSEEGHNFRTFSQNLFSDLKHAVQAAGSLQCRTCCHHGDDGQNNVDRRFTRRKT